MQIQFNAADDEARGVDDQAVHEIVNAALDRFAAQITRVEVHVRDVNAAKQGAFDKQCTMEARLAGRAPVAVTASSEDLLLSVKEAAGKLKRKIESDLERLSERR
jgi:ribosome-associated translation inhibitor RaiA